MNNESKINVVETNNERFEQLAEKIDMREYILKAKIIPTYIEKNKSKFKNFKLFKFDEYTPSQLNKFVNSFIALYDENMSVYILSLFRTAIGLSENIIVTNTLDSVVVIVVDDENKKYIKELDSKIKYIDKLNRRDSTMIEKINSEEVIRKALKNKPGAYIVNIDSFSLSEEVLFSSFDKKLKEIPELKIIGKRNYCKMYNQICYYDSSYKDEIDKVFVDLKQNLTSNIEKIDELYEYFLLSKEDQLKVLDMYKKDIDIIQKALEGGYISDLVINEHSIIGQFDLEE